MTTDSYESFEGNRTDIYCNISSINETKIQYIKWYKNYAEITDFSSINVSISDDNRTLTFDYLNRTIHNGNYTCEIRFISNQSIFSPTRAFYVPCKCETTSLEFNFSDD